MLGEVGKKTKLVARFSTVGGEKGSADSARDPRGFSVKFYTEEGKVTSLSLIAFTQRFQEIGIGCSTIRPSSFFGIPANSPSSFTLRSVTRRPI
jgi:hypothetical protein